MNALMQTWRQLVRRRLWPVALLLVAALVAVPVVLAKPADPAPGAPVATAAATPAATPADSYVELTSDDATTTGKRRRVLGAPKDPFAPALLPKVKHAKTAASDAARRRRRRPRPRRPPPRRHRPRRARPRCRWPRRRPPRSITTRRTPCRCGSA